MFNIEYELEKRFKKGLCTVFEKSEKFTYNKNKGNSLLKVTTEYPNTKTPNFNPHIVIQGINLNINMHSSFGYNFRRDVETNGIKNFAQEFVNTIPFSVTLVCIGIEDEAKDLANEVIQYLTFEASEYFSEILNLNLQGVQKGSHTLKETDPQKVFEDPVSVSGVLHWTGVKRSDAFFAGLDAPLKKVNIKYEE